MVGFSPNGCKESDKTEHELHMLRLPMHIYSHRASLVSQKVKNLPPMQDIWFQFLGKEDPLEKGMTTHSSILA